MGSPGRIDTDCRLKDIRTRTGEVEVQKTVIRLESKILKIKSMKCEISKAECKYRRVTRLTKGGEEG